MYLPQHFLAVIQAIGDLSFGGSTLRAPPLDRVPGATAAVQGFYISHWQATVNFGLHIIWALDLLLSKLVQGSLHKDTQLPITDDHPGYRRSDDN
jgi:hypothetical protein